MIAETFPVLADIEHDLDAPFSEEKSPFYGYGITRRKELLSQTMTKFDELIKSRTQDGLMAYEEGLKSHLLKAMTYATKKRHWSEYHLTLAQCHRLLCFAFFAMLIREYDNRSITFCASDYAASIGIDDFLSFSNNVCKTANDWGVFHKPSIADLMNMPSSNLLESPRRPNKEYNLLLDYPQAEEFLKRAVGEYLKDDYSLKTSIANASIIAYTIADELKMPDRCKYFESFWRIHNLSEAHSQVKTRTKINTTREILQLLLRKTMVGLSQDIEDSEKVRHYLSIYSK